MRFSAAVSHSQKLIHRLKSLSESCFKIVQLHLKMVQLHQRKFSYCDPHPSVGSSSNRILAEATEA